MAQYTPTLVATDDAGKMKYMQRLSVEIVTQVDSGEVGPRTYVYAVRRALGIDGWKLTNKPTTMGSLAKAGENTNVWKSETKKYSPRRDRFQRDYGNRP